MSETLKGENEDRKVENERKGLSRRNFCAVAGMGVLSSPFLIDVSRAAEPAATAAPAAPANIVPGSPAIINRMIQGMRILEVSEEIEPVNVFYRRESK